MGCPFRERGARGAPVSRGDGAGERVAGLPAGALDVVRRGAGATAVDERRAEGVVAEHGGERPGDGVDVERVDLERGVAGGLGDRRGVGGDDDGAAGHGLERWQTEPLEQRHVGERVGEVQELLLLRLAHVAEEHDRAGGGVRGRGLLLTLAPPARTGDDELHVGQIGVRASEAAERLHEALDVLARVQVAEAQDEPARDAGARQPLAAGGGVRRRERRRGVDGVRDDDHALGVEVVAGDEVGAGEVADRQHGARPPRLEGHHRAEPPPGGRWVVLRVVVERQVLHEERDGRG